MSIEREMTIIGFSGYPNAGKGTILGNLQNAAPGGFITLGISYILRKYDFIKDPTKLVPDEEVMSAIFKELEVTKNKIASKGESKKTIVFLDGLPRTANQAKFAIEKCDLSLGIFTYIPRDLAVERARDRIVCKNCGESYTIKDSFKQPKVKGICDKCNANLIERKEDKKSDDVETRWDDAHKNMPSIIEVFRDENIPTIDIHHDKKPSAEDLIKIIENYIIT